MKHRRITVMLGVFIAGTIGLLYQGGPRAIAADAGNPNDGSGMEVLTRGPVHEAFAEPISYNPTPGVVMPNEPPAAIEEIPPDERPEGDALWIPGYWQWDNERSDFIWISGIWRDPPPDRSWVPGYWTSVAGGWSWTPGFWTAAESDEVEYLPQPPESLEIGPSSPPPAPDRLWAPGSWLWAESRYAWRPGYWVSANPDWVWVPAHYVWTPRGYVYIDGYWDRTLERRGVLFAPMYVQRSVYARPDYVYSPSIVIQIGFLTTALFGSPGSHHYYFGDYYGQEYSQRGFRPWFEVDQRYRGYDPIYAHQRWHYGRTDNLWEQRVREDYDFRRQHVEARPSRTCAAQAVVVARAPEQVRKNLLVAAPLSEVVKRPDAPIRYEKISEDRRKSLAGQGKELAKYRDQRAQWESKGRQTSEVKPAQAAPRKEPGTSLKALSKKPGEVQPDRPSKAPVQLQPDKASKRQGELPAAQPPGRKKGSSGLRVLET